MDLKDKIVDDIRLLLIPKSYDTDSHVLGDPRQITIKANQEKIIVTNNTENTKNNEPKSSSCK